MLEPHDFVEETAPLIDVQLDDSSLRRAIRDILACGYCIPTLTPRYRLAIPIYNNGLLAFVRTKNSEVIAKYRRAEVKLRQVVPDRRLAQD